MYCQAVVTSLWYSSLSTSTLVLSTVLLLTGISERWLGRRSCPESSKSNVLDRMAPLARAVVINPCQLSHPSLLCYYSESALTSIPGSDAQRSAANGLFMYSAQGNTWLAELMYESRTRLKSSLEDDSLSQGHPRNFRSSSPRRSEESYSQMSMHTFWREHILSR